MPHQGNPFIRRPNSFFTLNKNTLIEKYKFTDKFVDFFAIFCKFFEIFCIFLHFFAFFLQNLGFRKFAKNGLREQIVLSWCFVTWNLTPKFFISLKIYLLYIYIIYNSYIFINIYTFIYLCDIYLHPVNPTEGF